MVHVDLALFLVEHGANVGVLDEDGWTRLHRASKNGHEELVRLLIGLIKHGAEADV